MKKVIAILGCLVFLAGCEEKNKPKDVDFYYQNEDVAKDVIKKCEVGDVVGLDCENAKKARSKRFMDNHSYKGK